MGRFGCSRAHERPELPPEEAGKATQRKRDLVNGPGRPWRKDQDSDDDDDDEKRRG